MSTYDDIIAGLQYYADHAMTTDDNGRPTADVDLRVAFGTPGQRVQVRGEVEATGQAYTTPGFVQGIAVAVAGIFEAHVCRDEFDVATVVGPSSFTLTNTPLSSTNLLGMHNGVIMRCKSGAGCFTLSGKVVTLGTAGALGDWYGFLYRY